MKIILLVLLLSITCLAQKYTVSEIDELRYALQERYIWGTTYSPPPDTIIQSTDTIHGVSYSSRSRVYNQQEMNIVVEQRLRTYMIAGIKAKDIYAEDKRIYLKNKRQ